MIEGKGILITGGAGFIVTSLMRSLIDGNRITVYDSLDRNALAGASLERHPSLNTVHLTTTTAACGSFVG